MVDETSGNTAPPEIPEEQGLGASRAALTQRRDEEEGVKDHRHLHYHRYHHYRLGDG